MSKVQLENCEVLAHREFAGKQRIITLFSKNIPKLFKAGQFVHISVGGNIQMRRPISIMTVNKDNNSFDLLYKIFGSGTNELAKKQIGDIVSVLGPIGNNFIMEDKKLPLLIGGGVGMPPMIALSQQLKDDKYYKPFVVLASEVEFPFKLVDSKINTNCHIKATMPLLERWGIACRLASLSGFDEVFQGYATDLAKFYLDKLSELELKQVVVYSCGPKAMLAAVSKLAKEYNLSAYLSLEEYMACGIGGCAGCAVAVEENNIKSMQRVCVDGPIFKANNIIFT